MCFWMFCWAGEKARRCWEDENGLDDTEFDPILTHPLSERATLFTLSTLLINSMGISHKNITTTTHRKKSHPQNFPRVQKHDHPEKRSCHWLFFCKFKPFLRFMYSITFPSPSCILPQPNIVPNPGRTSLGLV